MISESRFLFCPAESPALARVSSEVHAVSHPAALRTLLLSYLLEAMLVVCLLPLRFVHSHGLEIRKSTREFQRLFH